MIVMFVGIACGQLLLNLSSPTGHTLLNAASILVSLALIPVPLSASSAPQFAATEKMSFRQLYQTSPLGVVECAGISVAHGAALSMGALYR